MRGLLWTVAAVFVIVVVGWWLLKALAGLLFYLIIGALVVGGAMYLYGKAKRTLNNSGGERRLRR